MKITDEVALARQAKLARTWDINPLMAEIVEVLLSFSGAAHRDAVVDAIARRKSNDPASEGLRQQILEAVAIHRQKAEETGRPPLVYLPFGESCHRWALTQDVMAFMRSNGADVLPNQRSGRPLA
jgi:hypothetical protein